MNYLKQSLRMLAFAIALMLPLSSAQALERFTHSGKIIETRINTVTVGERIYRMQPNARFVSKDPNRRQFTDLEVGDHVSVLGDIVGGDYYVDFLQYYGNDFDIEEEDDD